MFVVLQKECVPAWSHQDRFHLRKIGPNVSRQFALSLSSFLKSALRLMTFPALIVCTTFVALERASADEVARIEQMLSWTERVGVDLERVKEVSTTLNGCELQMETEYSSPDPQPIGVKLQILTIDLTRVGRIEQSEFRGLYLVELYAYGFGSIFRPLEDMKAHTYSERRDGKKFESVENLTLNLFIPLPDRETIANDLRDYVEAYCSKGA
ncbi:hypothetical protein [uncultured Roseobacter sp.]|uniref:hypothetical protein n=1 Tax=uncultured Roseobacter sp. TaxID=114847 RepID=UPI002635E056|nr:hypothetical protein [uncultured Roseobacter sp.]